MKYKFFKIPAEGGPVEAELNAFAAAHQVVGSERHFVADGPDSFWSVCLRYLDAAEPAAGLRKGKVDYREVLGESDFAVYVKLRELRKEISEREGLPPYALFTNEQLASMLQSKVRTKQDMSRIEGIGPARIERYADRFLEVLKVSPGAAQTDVSE